MDLYSRRINMKKKLLVILVTLFLFTIIACSNGNNNDDRAFLLLNVQYQFYGQQAPQDAMEQLRHTVTVKGPSGIQEYNLPAGTYHLKETVSPGMYDISVEAKLNDFVFARGKENRNIDTGGDGNRVGIIMTREPYLYPLDEHVFGYSSSSVNFSFPNTNESFSWNYRIYYRIYVSNVNYYSSWVDSYNFSSIHPQLESDYNAIHTNEPSTSVTSTSQVASLFSSRKYSQLALDGTSIESELSSYNVNGKSMSLGFGSPAALYTDYYAYPLRRNPSSSNPKPDYKFENSADLTDIANEQDNTDVEYNPSLGAGTKYAYASFYIIAVGNNNGTEIYSRPAYLGTFKLP